MFPGLTRQPGIEHYSMPVNLVPSEVNPLRGGGYPLKSIKLKRDV
jgi:hypothetical protein